MNYTCNILAITHPILFLQKSACYYSDSLENGVIIAFRKQIALQIASTVDESLSID